MANSLSPALDSLPSFFRTGKTRTLEFRLDALSRLEKAVLANQKKISAALFADLHKPAHEALFSEIIFTLEELRITKKKLRSWMRPQKKGTPFALFPAKSRIYHEPLGTVLIIGPWNYPFQLCLAPLIGAIAAGNCAAVKPSELTPHTSRLIRELLQECFPPEYVRVVEGGIPETTALLEFPFDHFFFTGSTPVGKIVMQAAARNLTPVTLELGGKSPVIVSENADLDLAARRIVWGKFYNAGQTCVAPDYLYVQQSVAPVLAEKLKSEIRRQFGENQKESSGLARIVNAANFRRVSALIDPAKVLFGGQTDPAALYIQPTLLENISWSDSVMSEEIFGPLLPILTFQNLAEAFTSVNSKPKPLSAYLFSRSSREQREFVEQVTFGGGCVNDVLIHLTNPHLPFGGVGASGMGSYHGKNSFLVFSHAKGVMHRAGFLDLAARYAPYSAWKLKLLRWLFRV